jgi:acyl carrier protein
MERIPAQNGKKLMPSDVERYLAARSEAVTTSGYQDHLLTSQQRILVHRLKRSAQLVVPATLTYQLDWQALKRTQKELGEEYPETYPSEFETLAYSVAQATINYPRFRSTLVADDMVREYEHLNLGVAVHCPNDELVTAVMTNADTLDFPDFVRVARQQVSAALNGDDQATESTQFLLTYMVDYQIVAANPILVAPAIGILFVGTPYPQGDGLRSNLTITFDHRLINGVVAANFTKAIAEQLSLILSDEELEQKQSDGVTLSRSALLATPPTQRYQQLSKHILADVAQLLNLPPTELDSEIPLRELGITSRLSVELANTLAKRFGVEFAATLVWNYPTINALIGHLADKLEIPLEIPTKKSKSTVKESPAHSSRVEEIAALSDDDVALLLEQRLAALGVA